MKAVEAQKPCRACGECDGNHHFGDSYIEYADDEGDDETPPNSEHPAALAGHEMWMGCKHCDAWAEMIDDDESEDGFVLGPWHAAAALKGGDA